MTWAQRLSVAAYSSPSGARMTFDYEDVSRTVEKKTTGFEFPDAEGTFVQDLGPTGYRYPLRVILWGNDCDLDAAQFEGLLLERGIGRLEHPIYGTINVVPYGSVTRRDDLKSAANQVIIEVTFWETIDLIYPVSQSDPGSGILSALTAFNDAAASVFSNGLSIDTAVDRISFKNGYTSLLENVQSGLETVAEAQDTTRRQFDATYDSINRGVDVLVAEPLTLALQTQELIQAPARAQNLISDRLSAYGDLASSIFNKAPETETNNSVGRNQFETDKLFVSGYVTGSVLSAVNAQFETKTQALDAAESILDQFSSVTDWRDANVESLGLTDAGEDYQRLQEVVALTAGFLVEISFSLRQERRLVLDRARTIVDLAAELYGSVDDQLDFLINTNNLSGSEILELPRGREIVYYV